MRGHHERDRFAAEPSDVRRHERSDGNAQKRIEDGDEA
jgi:hypothetical protein